jgi:general secretion pathway protein E
METNVDLRETSVSGTTDNIEVTSQVLETPVPSVNISELSSLAQKLGLPFKTDLGEPRPPKPKDYQHFERITGSWARQFSTVPFAEEDGTILLATSNPTNTEVTEQISLIYGAPVALVVTTPDEVSRIINAVRSELMNDRSSSFGGMDDNENEDDGEFSQALKIDVTDAEDDDAPIIRYVNTIIFKASTERASDVHIEPFEQKLNVRFRIDGVLYDVDSKLKSFQAAIISRIKVMAGLNIAEKRLPQDGRFSVKIAGRSVDFRVSTIPTQFGERIVMRLLDKTATVLDLEQLGIAPENHKLLIKLIKKPNGIVLVTGPTGSGKTTTLYSCLSHVNTPELNILTVEDPIEYQLDGIGQMQVNPKIGFTFALGLRAILRQDPDVVMVGEIRDAETAEIAIQASLTGHLVFSTLHTNDSPGAITRLIDMGIEPFLVSSSVVAVLAQRLIRRLCPACKVPYKLTYEEILELGLPKDSSLVGKTVYRANEGGCKECQNTGFVGRSSIHELLTIDEAVKAAILQKADSGSIRLAAVQQNFRSLRRDGADKVLSGITSTSEIILATHEDMFE